MRTVTVYLRNATEPAVVDFLTQTYPAQKGMPKNDNSPHRIQWICEVEGDECLYIELIDDFEAYNGPEDWNELCANLGYTPTVGISADISGRHCGDKQVKEFIAAVLKNFEGCAQDGYSNHCWTVDEVMSGHLAYGLSFFDCQGWHENMQREMESKTNDQAPVILAQLIEELRRRAGSSGVQWNSSSPSQCQIQHNEFVLECIGTGRDFAVRIYKDALSNASEVKIKREFVYSLRTPLGRSDEILWVPGFITSLKLAQYLVDQLLEEITR